MRGEVDGQTAEDTLALTVLPVNDWPTLTAGIPAVTLQEGGAAVIDLAEHFDDAEQGARQLTYSAAPFDVGFPGNPVQTAVIENGLLTLQLSDHGIGFAQYAVRTMDDDGAQVATTLYVYVQPANDTPSATPMPDRYHSVSGAHNTPRVAIDLWYEYYYDQAAQPYFWDVEDKVYLDYSVADDNRAVFTVAPYVDEHDFLVYVPTDQPGFQGSALVTITARDRDGAEVAVARRNAPEVHGACEQSLHGTVRFAGRQRDRRRVYPGLFWRRE